MPDVIMSQQQHQLPAQVMTDSAVAGPAVGAGAVAMATALPSSPDARDVGEVSETVIEWLFPNPYTILTKSFN